MALCYSIENECNVKCNNGNFRYVLVYCVINVNYVLVYCVGFHVFKCCCMECDALVLNVDVSCCYIVHQT